MAFNGVLIVSSIARVTSILYIISPAQLPKIHSQGDCLYQRDVLLVTKIHPYCTDERAAPPSHEALDAPYWGDPCLSPLSLRTASKNIRAQHNGFQAHSPTGNTQEFIGLVRFFSYTSTTLNSFEARIRQEERGPHFKRLALADGCARITPTILQRTNSEDLNMRRCMARAWDLGIWLLYYR
jgi:hypothetical protein